MASSCLLKIGCALMLLAAIFLFPSAVAARQSAADVSIFPAPGSYTLGRIFEAPDAWVLEHSPWLPRSLSHYTSGKVTLLSFFYSTCRDPQGCPVIWSTYETIHEIVKKNPELHGKVRLVFISLDPRTDTPQTLELFSIARKDFPTILHRGTSSRHGRIGSSRTFLMGLVKPQGAIWILMGIRPQRSVTK